MATFSIVKRVGLPVVAGLAFTYATLATVGMQPAQVQHMPLQAPPERPFPRAIGAVGLVEPSSELIEIGTRVPGAIAQVHVQPNARVTRGTPLFTLDDTDLQAELGVRRQAVAVAEAELSRLKALPRPEDVPIARAAVAEAQSRLGDARRNLAFFESIRAKGVVTDEEYSRRQFAVSTAEAQVAQAQGSLDKLLAGAWREDLAVAQGQVAQARSAVARIEAEIERLTVRAPLDGVVLQVNAKPGSYAAAGALAEPLLVMGSPPPWHVRVDINEEDAWRVTPGAKAVAKVRGNAALRAELAFVRFEPYVVPKRALSGFAAERVDTRALQAIYRLTTTDIPVFVGQQVDVYIERTDPPAKG